MIGVTYVMLFALAMAMGGQTPIERGLMVNTMAMVAIRASVSPWLDH